MSLIWPCPDHDTDLEPDDGVGLWCPVGEHYLPAYTFDDADPDDWRDRMIDDREGTWTQPVSPA